ncbi:hypothetical protein BU17DRAFT_74766 [Hysterangium stoloniferum]|nr:hypothetical protein BU17DRAFT_74766 [Hysterangium stoloniferum]
MMTSLTPAELELIATEQLSILIRLISGTYRPFRPPTKPRFKKTCRLVAPLWLSFLQEKLIQETSAEGFSVLPLRFVEIGKVLLDMASEDLHNSDKIRNILKDLRETRQAKSQEGLRKLDHEMLERNLRLPQLCSMEIN